MAQYLVNYRNEFEATVEASSEEAAIRQVKEGRVLMTSTGFLWDDYFEIETADRIDSQIKEARQ